MQPLHGDHFFLRMFRPHGNRTWHESTVRSLTYRETRRLSVQPVSLWCLFLLLLCSLVPVSWSHWGPSRWRRRRSVEALWRIRQHNTIMNNEKSAQRDANTARWLYNAEPKKICPAAHHLHGGAGWPNFNQPEMVTTFTYKSSLVKIVARNFELSW